jgi:hypothetical protein
MLVITSRLGGWSFINKSTSREGFLLTLSRLATLALTPLFDGLKLCLCLVFLLLPTFKFIVPLEFLASLFAVVSFFPLLALVAAVLWLLRETVALGLKCRQTLVLVLERFAKCLHFIVLVVRIYMGDT